MRTTRLLSLVLLMALVGCDTPSNHLEMSNANPTSKVCWKMTGTGNNRIIRLDPVPGDMKQLRLSMSYAGLFKPGESPSSLPLTDERFRVYGDVSVDPGGSVANLKIPEPGTPWAYFELRWLGVNIIEVRAKGGANNWPTEIYCPRSNGQIASVK